MRKIREVFRLKFDCELSNRKIAKSCHIENRGQIFRFDKSSILCHEISMARPLRIELANGYYHVMNRGNNRQNIFLSDKDRKLFMEALAESCEIYQIHLVAYVLMTNHFLLR